MKAPSISLSVCTRSSRSRILISLAMLLAVTASIGVIASAKAAPSTTASPKGFKPFWKKFSAAMRSGDTVAAQAMTQLPFMLDGQWVTAKDYSRLWNDLLDRPTRNCLTKARTVAYADQMVAYCSGNMFIFAQTANGWHFIEIGVDD